MKASRRESNMSSKAKLTNVVTNETLALTINPTQYTLSQGFGFNVEPCLGQAAPLVSFKCGELTTLSFQLIFDKDAEKDSDPKKLLEFLKNLNKIDEPKQSVAEVTFTYGVFTFKGFVSKYTVNHTRFDDKGAPTSASADVTMLSTGGYESAK